MGGSTRGKAETVNSGLIRCPGSGHPAGLNFGDCIAYALAKSTGEPLLYKGDGFLHTDLPPIGS